MLICDTREDAVPDLFNELKRRPADVTRVTMVYSLREARQQVAEGAISTIFIDPLTLTLSLASDFIFRVRATHPSIVFVLYVDVDKAQSNAESFYRGRRATFRNFTVLDKNTPVADLPEALDPIIRRGKNEMRLARSQQEADQAITVAHEIARSTPSANVDELVERLEAVKLTIAGTRTRAPVRSDTVFLSYRFAEKGYVGGLKELLEEKGFQVITGEEANRSISAAVLERIKQSDFFLSLITRDEPLENGKWAASSWVIEEKGAALALGKYIVILIEEGVTGIGGLQGDWQRHDFAPREFTEVALKAVRQLLNAAGRGES